MDRELKPCPFCGGEANIIGGKTDAYTFYYVICSVCNTRSGDVFKGLEGEKKARETWNRRDG